MSVQAMSWAIKQQIATDASSRHVLLLLSNYADAEGEDAFPSVKRLCQDTGLSERTVRDRLGKLSSLGLIEAGNQKIAEAKGFRPDRTPTVYKLRFDRWKSEHSLAITGGVQDAHPDNNGVQDKSERGAGDAGTGCSSRTLTIIEPSDNRHTPIIPAERGDDIDAIWTSYPSWRRGSRKPVEASLRSAIKRGAKVADILDGIRRAVAYWPKTAKEPRSNFIPNLTTFLNQDRWTVTDEEHEANWSRKEAPRHQSAADLLEQNALRVMERMGMNR